MADLDRERSTTARGRRRLPPEKESGPHAPTEAKPTMTNNRSHSSMPRVPTRTPARWLPVTALGGFLLLGSVLSPSFATANPPASAAIGNADVSTWSDGVWHAAKTGDEARLASSLSAVPATRAISQAERLKAGITELEAHRGETIAERARQRAEAEKELTEALAKEDISKALTAAVKFQTLSDHWNDALQRDDVKRLVTIAEAANAKALETDDLLLAQEILFRLRTLNEENPDATVFDRYDDALDQVNRRIALIAQYAPHRLHELRSAQAARLTPDKPFPAWNPAFAEDWKEQLRGITKPMLSTALKTAANEHISSGGWSPLILGGLDALDTLASTRLLDETFPTLDDAAKVQEFRDAVQRGRDRIAAAGGKPIGRSDYNAVLGEILQVNAKTLAFPDSLILFEFGNGAVERLAKAFDDEYSEIIWPERLRRFQQQVDGDFVGVGILIRHDDTREIMIINPLEGSPAARGGVKSEDRIVAVDGVPTVGWALNKAVDSITGPRGKPVTLTLKRDGSADPVEISLVRDTIKIRSVNGWWKKGLDADGNPEWDWFIDPSAGIGYVRLTSFNEDSFVDFNAAIDAMRAERPLQGLILDLRFNPGGLLKSAKDFSNLFLREGEVVSGKDRKGQVVWKLDAEPNKAPLVDLPVVVLVNQGSASASEIVAGALQAHDVAVVLGDRTFGKGSVQTVHDVSDREASAAVKLTTQYYYLPACVGDVEGRCVHRKPGSPDWGVKPDLIVKMTPEQVEKSVELRQDADIIENWKDEKDREPRPEVKSLLADNLDPQLETALLILQARALKAHDAAAALAAR
jgi:carboxyl-terminal processing protease